MSGEQGGKAVVLAHPAFSVLEPVVRERLSALGHFPEPSELCALAQGIPSSIEPWFGFAEQDETRLESAGSFDALIRDSAQIPTRRGLHHDLLGALIWLHFPALKTALHRLHLAGGRGARSALQNAATHLDESGVLVVGSDSSLFEGLAGLEWHAVFWQQRARLVRSTRFLAFGHGLLDSLRAPHPRLMGKALFVQVSQDELALTPSALRVFLDRELAQRLPELLSTPRLLRPLPVLGVPTWSSEQSSEFYQLECYFRRASHRQRPPVPEPWLRLKP